MTQTETKQILAILKAAYPASYKGMTRDEAMGVVNVWATQFTNIPVELVARAVHILIGKSTFPPAIAEVKDTLRDIRKDAELILWGWCSITVDRTEEKLAECRAIENALKNLDEDPLQTVPYIAPPKT